LAIAVRSLSKRYRIAVAGERVNTFGEAVADRFRHPLRRVKREDFFALSDVNLQVTKGEAVGIVGRNGAGKSTLLKVLSRITAPTSGQVELYGHVGSLLEVGTGFHPELTGRENIFLNGAILGMKKAEIARQLDSIVEFSGVARFLETPVKRYSSGMYVRLAFAVAAHLNPDILIVDEVLSVGDAEFQKKCLGKMGEVTGQQGRTVLFVSHNAAAIKSLCQRGVYMRAGRVVVDGPVTEALGTYMTGEGFAADNAEPGLFRVPTDTSRRGLIQRLQIRDAEGRPTTGVGMGEGLLIDIDVEDLAMRRQTVTVRILTDSDVAVLAVNTTMKHLDFFDPETRARRLTLRIDRLPLTSGKYWIEVSVLEAGLVAGKAVLDHVPRAATFVVHVADVLGNGAMMSNRGPRSGLVFVEPHWKVYRDDVLIAATDAVEVAK